MIKPEIVPYAEALCATCPKRTFMSRYMARLGLTEANRTCPGPDMTDRFDALKVNATDFDEAVVPEGYKLAMLKGGSIRVNDMPVGYETRYYKSPTTRTETCPQDAIAINPTNESVTRAEQNAEGRLWIRIGRGAREAVLMADSDFGPNGAGHVGVPTPQEVLETERTVVYE